MKEVVWAVSGVAAAAVAVLLLLHWRRSRDRFFAYFAAGFVALAASTTVLLASAHGGEGQRSAYVVRLLAFVLIIVAIVDKNRARPTGSDPILGDDPGDG